MTARKPALRKHVWISNAEFTRLTGIKKVCMDCGQPKYFSDDSRTDAYRECPGKRPKR